MAQVSGREVTCDGCGRREQVVLDGRRAPGSKTTDDLMRLGWVLWTEREVGDGSNVHLCPACAG